MAVRIKELVAEVVDRATFTINKCKNRIKDRQLVTSNERSVELKIVEETRWDKGKSGVQVETPGEFGPLRRRVQEMSLDPKRNGFRAICTIEPQPPSYHEHKCPRPWMISYSNNIPEDYN